MNKAMKCDCQGCKERFVGCHATCEKYKKYCAENEKLKKKRKEDSRYVGDTSWSYLPKRK